MTVGKASAVECFIGIYTFYVSWVLVVHLQQIFDTSCIMYIKKRFKAHLIYITESFLNVEPFFQAMKLKIRKKFFFGV